MITIKKLGVFFVIAIICLAGIFIFKQTPEIDGSVIPFIEDKEVLNNKIKLGLIQVYVTLPENKNDVYSELTYQTPQGECNIYRDIFGRFYCRW